MVPPPEVPALPELVVAFLTLGEAVRFREEAGALCIVRELDEELRILSENDLEPLLPLASLRVPKRFDGVATLR